MRNLVLLLWLCAGTALAGTQVKVPSNTLIPL